MLLATDFLCEALARATAILGLTWRAGCVVQREGPGASVREDLAFPGGSPRRWLAAEADTGTGRTWPMTLRLRIAIPRAHPQEDGYATEGQMQYVSFHDTPDVAVDPDHTSDRRAATLAMVLRVLRCAGAFCGADRGPAEAPGFEGPHGASELVTAIALARMLRADAVTLPAGSPALRLLQDGAAGLDAPGAGSPAPGQAWFRQRLDGRLAIDPYRDSVLLDLERAAQRQLGATLAGDPLGRLLLLREATRERPDLWSAVRMHAAQPAHALAHALQIPPESVPEAYVDALVERFPGLAPGDAACRSPMEDRGPR